MRFHKQPLPRCGRCDKPASYEVRNSYNAVMGWFCDKHADQKISELEKAEREAEGLREVDHG